MKIEVENLNQKIKNGILIGIIGFEILFWKNEMQNLNQKIENLKTEIEITKTDCKIDFDIPETLAFDDGNIRPQGIVYKKSFFEISKEEKEIICGIVAGEAKGESVEGKMAVAQCICNAMLKDGLSAIEVKNQYKYSGWDSELKNTNPELWSEIENAVNRVFDNGEVVSDKPILFFYAPKYVKSRWHETLSHAVTIGGHRFFYLDEDVNADWFIGIGED